MEPVTGYLAADNRHNALSLVVPCDPCRSFHWHGAGTVEQPQHSPGDVTDRVTHCPNGNDYSRIRISGEPFRREWITPRRARQSSAFRRAVAR